MTLTTGKISELLQRRGLSFDSIGRDKYKNIVIRREYFYTHGYDEKKFAQALINALSYYCLAFEIVEAGNHWAPFKSGASVSKSSHFWVKFRIN